ncbi:xylose dehydrogenase (NAD/NADP) [Halarchaeum solikamskense]|uniref:D-xylose 1-dehydrogenase Gfo6 n=1 Tax=Halarchaeum nitratireducens TaxID=489913 RepID=UPI001B3AEAF7|nr:D-xylose 1-dehydrogenase Gfo6 [Halarchaeum solikamskense]MBP2252349.1 xylose dehydrogenase (NAD/NADP) [Halarchaeum solikamskense]
MATYPLLERDSREWQTVHDGTVRFALVGVGWWTQEFVLPAIEASELCTTTAVVTSSAAKAERVRESYDSIDHGLTYDEFADGTAAEAYDAVYVCTPNATHLEHVESAVDLGKDVLCEKPMEATRERAEAVVEAASGTDVTLMVAYRMHTEPAVRHARDLIRNGVIGEPTVLNGENSQPLLEMIPDADQWRLNPDLTGYGASVMDLGIYPLNTARFLLDADPIAVQSMMRSAREEFEDVPDEHAAFSVEYDDGTLGSFTSSQNGSDETRLEVVGTEGRIELHPAFHMETGLTVARDGTTVSVETEQVDQMEYEFDYFANQALAGEPVYADGEHGLVDMYALEAIYEAAETGQTTSVRRP